MNSELEAMMQSTRAKTKEILGDIGEKTDEAARKQPWIMIGIFALLASIFGFLLGRSSKR